MQRTTALIRYRASDSVPERTDRTRRYPIPPRHPHRKIRKSGDKFLSPLFRIRFFSRRDSGLHLRKERQKLRDGIRLRTLPLRPQRPPPPVVFSPVVFPINAFPDDASADFNAFSGKSRQTFPSLSDSRKSAARRQPKNGTLCIVTRRSGGPDAPDRSPEGSSSHRTTGRNEESILPKALTNPSGHAGRPHRGKRKRTDIDCPPSGCRTIRKNRPEHYKNHRETNGTETLNGRSHLRKTRSISRRMSFSLMYSRLS